ncbi:hypothetical protein EON81_15640 [bacterium]|nr:MAG: hypothetical protein EON81_15640 [bacterium]
MVETLAVVDSFWSLYLGDQPVKDFKATFEMEVDVTDPGSLERFITKLDDGAGDPWESIYQWRRVECLDRISSIAGVGQWVLDIYTRLGPREYLERFHELLRGPEMRELIRFPAVYLGPGCQLTQDEFVRVFIKTQRLIDRIIEIDSEMKPKPFPSPSRGNDLPVNRPPQS